jgi:hypothetical protein
MKMKTRREFIQGLILSVGGAATLSACGDNAPAVMATAPNNPGRFYTSDEMLLVNRVADLIIPETETPGALQVNVAGYLDGLMSDWASAQTQEEHRLALIRLRVDLDAAVSGEFVSVSQADAEAALAALDARAFESDQSLQGYRTLKGWITQAYFATEAGAVQELKWVALPGRWDASVDINPA